MSNKTSNPSGGSNPQIQLTNRQLQMRNYHAKKMAEKRKEAEIMQQIHSSNGTSSSAGGSATGGDLGSRGKPHSNYGRQLFKESAPTISNSTARTGAIDGNRSRYRDREPHYGQRSLLQQQHPKEQQQQSKEQQQQHQQQHHHQQQQQQPKEQQHRNLETEIMQNTIALTNKAVPSSRSDYKTKKYRNDEMGKTSISPMATPSPLTRNSPLPSSSALSPAPSATSALSTLTKSSPMQTIQLLDQTKGMTTHQKAAFMASLRYGSSHGSGGKGEPAVNLRPKIDGNEVTRRESAAVVVSSRSNSVIGASGGNDKSNDSDSATNGGFGASVPPKANSTIGTASLDNREKMKRMFAARRRKAQLEMSAPGGNGGESFGNEGGESEMGRFNYSSSNAGIHTYNDGTSETPTKSTSSTSSSSTEKIYGSDSSLRFSRKAYEKYIVANGAERSGINGDSGSSMDVAKFSGVGMKLSSQKNESSQTVVGNSVAAESPSCRLHATILPKQHLRESSSEKDAVEDVVLTKKLPESILRESSSYDPNESKTVRFQLPTPQMDQGQRNPQCSPPRPRKFTNDESTSEKRYPSKVKPDVVLIPDVAMKGDNEDIDYVLFIADLKREIATDHSEVSFCMSAVKKRYCILF